MSRIIFSRGIHTKACVPASFSFTGFEIAYTQLRNRQEKTPTILHAFRCHTSFICRASKPIQSNMKTMGDKRGLQSSIDPGRHKKIVLCAAENNLDEKSSLTTQNLENNLTSQTKTKNQLVIVIAGPTGVGKSDAALRLCQSQISNTILSSYFENNNIQNKENVTSVGNIISADSVQAYKGVNIGANKPSKEELERVKHHLVDVVEPNGQSSAASWREDAIEVIHDITKQNSKVKQNEENYNNEILPVVVGGTMMYLQWLVHGRPDAVKPTPEAIIKAEKVVEKYQFMEGNEDGGWKMALEETYKLGKIFKERVDKLPGKDWYRLRRTLEVAYTIIDTENQSNLKLDELEKQQEKLKNTFTGKRLDSLSDLGYDVRCFFLCPNDRMHHCTLVDERCEKMLLQGLLKETTDLSIKGDLPLDGLPAKAIGYRQALEYLTRDDAKNDDSVAFSEFLNVFTAATRQYSKKQMSWFRKDKEFMFIPVTLIGDEGTLSKPISKQDRVKKVVDHIIHMCSLSRDKYERELCCSDSSHISVMARKMNTDQAKGMKVYQGKRYHLIEGGNALINLMIEADQCTEIMKRELLS